MSIFRTPYTIEEEIVIKSSADTVWEKLTDFTEKSKWSPWYTLEPQCSIEKNWSKVVEWFTEKWNWKLIWEWSQKIIEVKNKEYIEWELEFVKPMKSKANNKFFIEKSWDEIFSAS